MIVSAMTQQRKVSLKQIVSMLRAKQGEKSVKEFAREIRVTPQCLWSIYRMESKPSAKVLAVIGVQRTEKSTITYESVR